MPCLSYSHLMHNFCSHTPTVYISDFLSPFLLLRPMDRAALLVPARRTYDGVRPLAKTARKTSCYRTCLGRSRCRDGGSVTVVGL